jgi:hypothetical protein
MQPFAAGRIVQFAFGVTSNVNAWPLLIRRSPSNPAFFQHSSRHIYTGTPGTAEANVGCTVGNRKSAIFPHKMIASEDFEVGARDR